MFNISGFTIYYYNNKLRQADTKGQEVELPKNQRVKDYKETEVFQKRCANSLEKRRKIKQEQESECSKFVQDRA